MADKALRIVLMGPQGSGKGTQAQLLGERYHLPYISTGDMFRQAVKEQTDLGKKIKDLLDRGELVPDELTNALVAERLSQPDCQAGFILDGFPRNLDQAKFLLDHFSIDFVFEIDISDDEAVKRISGRRVCDCGMTYHIIYNPPQQEGVCDRCGGELKIRSDDQEEAVRRRLQIYHDQTAKIIPFFQEQGIFYHINGQQPIADVNKDIVKIISEHGFDQD